ncbi:tetratricopeptide repeat-containing sensor histidine kinase [Puia sp.]|jgi:signal transduction histidine kinase|uniref:tetratricopeptide repeat-containing sensor histidine kinase n=1 Tax=Puia sp. TaxID=2045100 RepID=UPI002F4222B3
MKKMLCCCCGILLLSLFVSGQELSRDSLLAIVRKNTQDAAEAKAMVQLAGTYRLVDVPKSFAWWYEAIALSKRINDTLHLSHAYNGMANSKMHIGSRDSAMYYLSLLQKLAEAPGATRDVKADYHQTAGAIYELLSQYKTALPFRLAALEDAVFVMHKEHDPPFAKAYTAGQYLNVGNTYNAMGEYRNALTYLLEGLTLFEETGVERGVAYCYQGISVSFSELGQYEKAFDYTYKGLALKRKINDLRGIGTALKQLGTNFRYMGKQDSAIAYYTQALKVFQTQKMKVDEADQEFDLGTTYSDKHDLANAQLHLTNAITVAAEAGDSIRFKAANAALVGVRAQLKGEERDENKLMSSLRASIEENDRQGELANYQYLSQHFERTKHYDKALEYAKLYYNTTDTLQRSEIKLQLSRMEAQYNIDKKEHEIRLLKKDQELTRLEVQRQRVIVESQKAFEWGAVIFVILLVAIGVIVVNRNRVVHNARRMVEMEKMRNNIARDLHDDIGSTLTSINVLSKVALQPQADGFMEHSLQKIKDRSGAIMERMDDIVWAINPQNDTMEQLLMRMKEFAAELLEPSNIRYRFEEEGDLGTVRLDVRRRRDLYLLFKEAVNNAAKYSQCSNLTIRLRQERGSLQMEISDDGKGFVTGEVIRGNGLNNMRERAAAMAGKIWIDSAVGQGTRIVLDAAL